MSRRLQAVVIGTALDLPGAAFDDLTRRLPTRQRHALASWVVAMSRIQPEEL